MCVFVWLSLGHVALPGVELLPPQQGVGVVHGVVRRVGVVSLLVNPLSPHWPAHNTEHTHHPASHTHGHTDTSKETVSEPTRSSLLSFFISASFYHLQCEIEINQTTKKKKNNNPQLCHSDLCSPKRWGENVGKTKSPLRWCMMSVAETWVRQPIRSFFWGSWLDAICRGGTSGAVRVLPIKHRQMINNNKKFDQNYWFVLKKLCAYACV